MSVNTPVVAGTYSREPFDQTDEEVVYQPGKETSTANTNPVSGPGGQGKGDGNVLFATSSTHEGTTTTVTVESLPPASRSTTDIAIMVISLAISSQEAGAETAEVTIQMKKSEMQALNAEAERNIADAIASMAKSEKGGMFGKVFGWVAVVAAVVVATVTVNPAMMAVAVMGIAMMTSQETGLTEKIAEKMGNDAFIALMVVIMVVMVVAPMAAPAALGGATSAATTTANVTVESTKLARAGQVVATTAQGVEGGAAVGAGASQIVSAKHQHDATTSRADSDRSIAKSDRQQAMIDEVIEFFVEFMEKNDGIIMDAGEIIDSAGETNRHIASSTA